MLGNLTVRQEEVLSHIIAGLRERQCYPTYRELCALIGVRSVTAVRDHLLALTKKGYIEWDRRAAGSRKHNPYRLTEEVQRVLEPNLDKVQHKLEKIRILMNNLHTYVDLSGCGKTEAVEKIQGRILEIIEGN